MNPLQVLTDFFKEMLNRVMTKSPVFFTRLQVFSASLTFAGYIPSMLQVFFKVEVSGQVISVCEDIAKYSTSFFAATLLAVKSPIVGQTVEGSVVKVTDENRMPFSAKAEQKEIANKVPPPEVLSDVPETPPEEKFVAPHFTQPAAPNDREFRH